MKKRVIAFLTAVAVACTSTTAYAHDSDVFGGKYSNLTEANFFVRIHSSAENDFFTFYDTYIYGEDWNGISSNVDLYVMRVGESVSTAPNQINVFGVNPYERVSIDFLGRTVPFDKNGKNILNRANDDAISEGLNEDWLYSNIEIDISPAVADYYNATYYFNMEEIRTVTKKVFAHELGHALKLAHPVQSATHSGSKSYDGYPYAIMNNGLLDGKVCDSKTITDHDKSCLIAKWGK